MSGNGRLRRVSRALMFGCALLGVTALIALVGSFAVFRYDTLRFDRASREVRVETRSWVRNPTYEPPAVVESSVDTSLLRLRRRTIDLRLLNPSVVPSAHVYWPGAGSALAVNGTRSLIADRTGAFYEVDLEAGAEAIERLPLTVDTNYALLRDLLVNLESEGDRTADGAHGSRYVGVTDLLFLTSSPMLAAAYSRWDPRRQCVTHRVAVLDLDGEWRRAEPSAWRLLYESWPCLAVTDPTDGFRGNQSGGRLAELSDRRLCLVTGDFGHDGVVNRDMVSQDQASSYGKVIEIDVDTGAHRIVATGLRNPQGLARDSRGRLWSTEHGPRGGDELNLIRAGSNYGWPLVTLGTNYDSHEWPLSSRQGRHDGYQEPIYAWTPSIGVSNLTEIRNFSPRWDGDLLVLSLLGRRLSRLSLSGERVVMEEPIPMGERLRDIEQLSDGRIVLWTDTAKILVLSVDTSASPRERMMAAASPQARAVLARCAECHTMAETEPSSERISLWQIHDRPIATGNPALYSDALRKTGGRWNARKLDQFLESPQRMVPGTTMQFGGIADDRVRAEIVDALKQLQ